jgi:hypothetical protein
MAKQHDLRNEANAQYYFDEIKLWHDARPHHTVGIIVEAKSDEILFRKLLHARSTFFAADGNQNAIEILKLCKKYTLSGVFALLDADFQRISTTSTQIDGVFFTDCHDKEMMMAHSDAWHQLLNSYGEPTKINHQESKKGKTILNFLLETIQPIGVLRWLNHSKNLGLTFKVLSNNKFKFIDYEDFIDEKNLKVDSLKLLKAVENKSQKQNFFKNNLDLKKEWDELITASFDLKELCNGHDLLNVLALALMNFIGNRKSSVKISGETLEEGLILAYRLEDFVKTQLFESLSSWEKAHAPFKVHRI